MAFCDPGGKVGEPPSGPKRRVPEEKGRINFEMKVDISVEKQRRIESKSTTMEILRYSLTSEMDVKNL